MGSRRRWSAGIAAVLAFSLLAQCAVPDPDGLQAVAAAALDAASAASAKLAAASRKTLPHSRILSSQAPVRAFAIRRYASPLDRATTGVALLAETHPHESVKAFMQRAGAPWFISRDSHLQYLVFDVELGHTWLVVTSARNQVVGAQLIAKNGRRSHIADRFGIAIGDVALPAGCGPPQHDIDGLAFCNVRGSGSPRVYGFDKTGHIDRIGWTTGTSTMPTLIRWYNNSGWSPDRAVPLSSYKAIGETSYLQQLDELRFLPCTAGNHWHELSRKRIVYAHTPLDEVEAQCGTTGFRHPIYFAATAVDPHPLDAAPYRSLLDAPAVSVIKLGGTSGQIWFTTPTQRCIINANCADSTFEYIDDPNNPLNAVTVTQVAPPSGGLGMMTAAKHGHVKPLGAIACGWGNGAGKCTLPQFEGNPCFGGFGTFGSFQVAITAICDMAVADSLNQPHSCHGSGASGGTGNPVDVVSGKLWYKQSDAVLSGPMGLEEYHRYDSDRSESQVNVNGLGGYGWRDRYSNYLQSVPANDSVVYWSSDCQPTYFTSPTITSAGTYYDSYTGNQLTVNSNGTMAVTTWSRTVLQFTAAGVLTSIADRIGNTQTIARDGQGRIQTVTDVLGRSLIYSYDSQNRISTITSNPSGVSITYAYDTGTNCFTGDLCTATESDGKTWTYEYYNPTSYPDPVNPGNGNYHLLMEVLDPLGHVEEYNTYELVNFGVGDVRYRVATQAQDSGKNARSFTYTYAGNFQGSTTITDYLGTAHQSVYTWSSLLQEILSVSGPLCQCQGNTIGYTYDNFGSVLSVLQGGGTSPTVSAVYGRDVVFVSPDGKTTYPTTAYTGPTSVSEYGIQTQQGAATRTVALAYYPLTDIRSDLVQTQTEASVDTPGSQAYTTFTYSTAGLLTALARTGYSNHVSGTNTTSFAYDGKGRVQTITGPRTDLVQKTSYVYYPDTDSDLARRGQLNTVTDAASHTTTFAGAPSPYNTYNIFGSPKSIVDPNAVVRDFTFDARGRPLTVTLKGVTGDPNDLTTTVAYDAAGRLTSQIRPLLNSSTLTYDSNNNVTNVIRVDAAGAQHEQALIGYDAISRPSGQQLQGCSTPAPMCSTWVTTYSSTPNYTPVDQVASISYGANGASQFGYDTYGNSTSAQSGDTTYTASAYAQYDPNHNVVNDHLANGDASLTYKYDLQLNRTNAIPAGGAPNTVYTYDDFKHLIRVSSPYTGVSTYVEDPAGNVTSRTDANGATTTMVYDALNRRTSAVSTRSGYTTETCSWAYDSTTAGNYGIGRLASVTDPSGSTTYTYERRGLRASQVQTVGSTQYTTSYKYDGNGNRITQTLPSARVLTYTFDYADRPQSVASTTATYVSAASYEPFGPVTQLQFGNGTTQTWAYSTRYLPSENKVTHGATTLADFVYTNNAAGFVGSIADAVSSGYSRTFAYGGRAGNMLTGATTGASLWGSATFADAYNQNLSSVRIPGSDYGLAYNRAQQLTSIFNADSGTSQTVTHDAAGNETAVGTATYTYSARNHLATGDGVSYTYDGYGYRVSATSSSGTRTSIYDAARHLESETSLTSGSVAYEYIWLGDIPVAQEDTGGQTHWTATDHLHTPYLQTSSTAAIYWQADYSPLGEVYSLRTADAHQPLRMAGQEAEEFVVGNPNGATPRYYNGLRWYRSAIGRYTQADPLEYGGGAYNLYTYANNNALNYFDLLGAECSGNINFGAAIGLGIALTALTLISGGADLAIPLAFALGDIALAAIGAALDAAIESAALSGLYASMASTAAMASGVGIAMGAAFAAAEGSAGGAAAEVMEGGAPGLENGVASAAENLGPAVDGATAQSLAADSNNIVLGMESHGLAETAARFGGRTLMGSTNFPADFGAAMANPATRFTLNLDGLSGDTVEAQILGAAQSGARGITGGVTNWEIYQLYFTGRIGTTTLVQGGQVVSNPFAR